VAIRRFFVKDITVRRQKELGGSKVGYTATSTTDGYFEALDPQTRAMLGIIETRAWTFWFDVDEDIKEGDILYDSDDNQYYVIEVTKRDIGINQHLEVLAREYNE